MISKALTVHYNMASQEKNVPVVAATTAATPVSVDSHGALHNKVKCTKRFLKWAEASIYK